MIHDWCSDYRFYLRFQSSVLYPTEITLFALSAGGGHDRGLPRQAFWGKKASLTGSQNASALPMHCAGR